MSAERQALLQTFLGEVWCQPNQVLVITTREQHAACAAGRSGIYFDHGVVPATYSPKGEFVLGICPDLLLEGTDWMDTGALADYFDWWWGRINVRFLKQNQMAATGIKDEDLIEDLVNESMAAYAYPQEGWWQ